MATLYEGYNVGDDDGYTIYGGYWSAQTFTVGAVGHSVTSVKLKMYRLGTPGVLTVSIRATGGDGKPTGGDLTSGTTDANLFTTSAPGQFYEIAVTRYILSPNTKYAIIIRISGGDWGNCVAYRCDSSSPTYSGGNWLASSNSGSSWGTYTGVDMMFEVWGSPWPYGKVTVTGTAKGGYPTPSMRLEIYEKDVLVLFDEIPSDQLLVNQPYALSYDLTSPRYSYFQGRMILTNPIKQVAFNTEYLVFGVAFTVYVINKNTAAPVSGALVTMYCVSGAWAGKTLTGTTGADGTVDFYPFESGNYNLTVTKAGFNTYSYPNMPCGPGGGFTAGLTPG